MGRKKLTVARAVERTTQQREMEPASDSLNAGVIEFHLEPAGRRPVSSVTMGESLSVLSFGMPELVALSVLAAGPRSGLLFLLGTLENLE